MKILQSDITASGLAEHACRAVAMFRGQWYADLINDYGYAVANGREHVVAIREDFERAIFGGAAVQYRNIQFLSDSIANVKLKTYPSNEIGIAASYEGIQIAQNGDRLAVFDLVVFGNPQAGYEVSIEDVYEHRFTT